jgi:hypothetical protein
MIFVSQYPVFTPVQVPTIDDHFAANGQRRYLPSDRLFGKPAHMIRVEPVQRRRHSAARR